VGERQTKKVFEHKKALVFNIFSYADAKTLKMVKKFAKAIKEI
jgi:hypothetical protein